MTAPNTTTRCGHCLKITDTKRCGGCGIQPYCSNKCLQLHWKTHRRECWEQADTIEANTVAGRTYTKQNKHLTPYLIKTPPSCQCDQIHPTSDCRNHCKYRNARIQTHIKQGRHWLNKASQTLTKLSNKAISPTYKHHQTAQELQEAITALKRARNMLRHQAALDNATITELQITHQEDQ